MCTAGKLPHSTQQQLLARNHHFYEKIALYLSQGYAVVYVVENDVTQVVRNLSKTGIAEVEDYIESGALTIINADSFYSPSGTKLDYNVLLPQWQKVVSSISKKGKFKGIMAMGMPHPAFFDGKENQQKLVEYEEQVAKHYDNKIQIFCCYTEELVAKLPLSHLVRLLAAHQDIAGSNQEARKIIDLIEEGLAKALGSETSTLVLRTLKLVYKIDRDCIISNPELFEEKIKRMFGEETAGSVLRIIADSINDKIAI